MPDHPAKATLAGKPIRDLGLTIAGTPLEPILAAFVAELEAAGITRLRPRFYLSTEWGVPFETISLAIPFYLARPDLIDLHRDRTGLVEGTSPADILRYLRHEMGHVVNYAYRLYESTDWVRCFGSITQPYVDDFVPRPFSSRFVHHLPGWYAQKHPDEDWAETFAVWLTPGARWRGEASGEALAKLQYCARTMADLAGREPLVTAEDRDEDVDSIEDTLDEHYADADEPDDEIPPGLDAALRTIFEDLGEGAPRAGELLRRLLPEVAGNVYRWTGHSPERTRALIRHLAERADALALSYPPEREAAATVALTALITALATSYVQGGSYLPK